MKKVMGFAITFLLFCAEKECIMWLQFKNETVT